jgi:hypothetical protein
MAIGQLWRWGRLVHRREIAARTQLLPLVGGHNWRENGASAIGGALQRSHIEASQG